MRLQFLRDEILGPKLFDYAFQTYIKRWAYKHPTPWDFFRTMENAGGEDLGWFWKGMFIENYKLDQAVTSVKYVKVILQMALLLQLKIWIKWQCRFIFNMKL